MSSRDRARKENPLQAEIVVIGTELLLGTINDTNAQYLAQRLAESAPGPSPKRVFFTNSGAEAIEAALKLARRHTGRNRALAFMNAFHGRTYGAMSLSGGSKPMQRRGFSPLVPEIHHARYGDLESVHALLLLAA